MFQIQIRHQHLQALLNDMDEYGAFVCRIVLACILLLPTESLILKCMADKIPNIYICNM